jgi:ATP-dependent protease ClpP protease subunit
MSENDDLKKARVALLKAQTDGQIADNRLAEALATTSELATRSAILRSQWDAAAPSLHRTFYFNYEIDQKSVESTIDTLARWDRIDNENSQPDREYKFVICSGGGNVIVGFQLYSFLKGLAERRPLVCVATGICASMATILHQAASDGQRIIEPGCTYLLHELSGTTAGRLDNIQDSAEFLNTLNEKLRQIYADRSGLSTDEIKKRVERRERYLTAEEVIEWNLADKLGHG